MPNYLSELEVRKRFDAKYFDNKASPEGEYGKVDMCLLDKHNNPLLYIETKAQGEILDSGLNLQGEFQDKELRSAIAQIILTNRQQENIYGIINKVAVAYVDIEGNDILHYATWDDDNVMFNNDINWKGEKPSGPTIDAVNRINDRLKGKIATYKNEEIKEFVKKLLNGENTQIEITTKNMVSVFSNWKQQVEFCEDIKNEQEFIYLFLTDLAKGEKYNKKVKNAMGMEYEISLIKQNTDLAKYELKPDAENVEEIRYKSNRTEVFTLKNINKYKAFWKTYRRPPSLESFEAILEHQAKLYTDKYRRTTGAEYTPYCFVKKQNELIEKYYGENWQDEYIVYDPCCGVGNLENEFPKEFKQQYCFMSTLEQGDVDVCKIKHFENAITFDYLKDASEPTFAFQGEQLTIDKIAERTGRKLMIIMNPPYQRVKGHKFNLAIEFYNKVCRLKPETIVFYYQTESFLRDEIEQYINSKYKIVSHIMSNAKTTFLLSEWPISQIIFDKTKGTKIDKDNIKVDRYEFNEKLDTFDYKKTYTYNNKPNLIKEIEKKIKDNSKGGILGKWCYLNSVLKLNNFSKDRGSNDITTENLFYCMLSNGINFNTHHKYFEWNHIVYKGLFEDIKNELYGDAILMSLYYKNTHFTNKKMNNCQYKNYIMPYTAEELGCNVNDLNVLFWKQKELFDGKQEEKTMSFDFRKWLKQFEFSKEAKDLYNAGLKIFRYYHGTFNYENCGFQKSVGADFNDSFYDITNAIMGKDSNSFTEMNAKEDTRVLYKVKTAKKGEGIAGFGRNTIKKRLEKIGHSEFLQIFIDFFDKRDILAEKINKQLVESGLLLWERENIY